jgi:hypothetical protein
VGKWKGGGGGGSKSVEEKEKRSDTLKKPLRMTLRERDEGINEAEKENNSERKATRTNRK